MHDCMCSSHMNCCWFSLLPSSVLPSRRPGSAVAQMAHNSRAMALPMSPCWTRSQHMFRKSSVTGSGTYDSQLYRYTLTYIYVCINMYIYHYMVEQRKWVCKAAGWRLEAGARNHSGASKPDKTKNLRFLYGVYIYFVFRPPVAARFAVQLLLCSISITTNDFCSSSLSIF